MAMAGTMARRDVRGAGRASVEAEERGAAHAAASRMVYRRNCRSPGFADAAVTRRAAADE